MVEVRQAILAVKAGSFTNIGLTYTAENLLKAVVGISIKKSVYGIEKGRFVFLDGVHGLIICKINAYETFLKYAKLYLHYKNQKNPPA